MSFRKSIKRIGRKVAAVHAKVGKVAIPVAAGVATYFAGPVAGEGVAYLGTRVQKKAAEAGYRGSNKELTGHERSQKARAIANRTFKYSQIGIGAGAMASAAVSVAGGSSFVQTAGKVLLGQAGGKLVGIGSGQYGTSTRGVQDFDSGTADLDTAVTSLGNGGGGRPMGLSGMGPTNGTGAGNRHSWTDQILGGLGAMAGGALRDPGQTGSGKTGWDMTNPFSFTPPEGQVSGEGGGLLSNPLVLGLIAVGAILFLKK